jgi:ERF superfamily
MKTSETINELAAALAKAQGEMKAALKASTNPHFRSRFADLASCMAAATPALSKHGLAITQATELAAEGQHFALVTRLMHASGQWIEAAWPLATGKPQEMGSQLTYARRYSLALIGLVTDEDDDAEAAHGRNGSAQAHSPHPDTSSVNSDVSAQYADNIRAYLNVNDIGGVKELHLELKPDEVLYSDVWKRLTPPERAQVKKILGQPA